MMMKYQQQMRRTTTTTTTTTVGMKLLPSYQTILIVLVYRFLNCLISRTFFQPDEFYQSIEISHRIVFGYGYQTWEWRNDENGRLRGPIHPLIFVPGYKLLKILGIDDIGNLILIVPKITQAIISTVNDLATFVLAKRLLKPIYGPAALACSLTSFFNAYAGIRTLSNSTETALTACALAFWPWTGDSILRSWSDMIISIVFISLTIIIRPSSALFWSLLIFQLLKNSRGEARLDVISLFAVMGVISAFICFLIDSSFYGTPTFTPYNFLKQNVLNDISSFYGPNRWHFYFTQAFTFVNLSTFPTVLIGMISLSKKSSLSKFKSNQNNSHDHYLNEEDRNQSTRLRSARFVVLGTMIGLSMIDHKEFRFIQPLIPLFNCFAARAMVENYLSANPDNDQEDVDQKRKRTGGGMIKGLGRSIRSRPVGFILRSMISIGVGIYFLSFHYLGQVSVMDYLRHRPDQELKSVGFLMPCHSTPWQSHLHKPRLDPIVKRKIDGNVEVEEVEERMWMLSCEPRIKGLLSNNDEKNLLKEDLEDESDRFYKDINGFIKLNFPSSVDPKFPPNLKTKIRHLSKPFNETSSKDDKINHGSIGNSSSKLIRVEEKRNYQWPSHLVIFESLLYPIEKDKRPDLQKIEKNDDERDFNSNGISSSKHLGLINHLGKDYLNRLGYELDFNCFNGFFHYDQSRRGGRVLVFKWKVR